MPLLPKKQGERSSLRRGFSQNQEGEEQSAQRFLPKNGERGARSEASLGL